jgi:hypothetical protein
LGINQIQMQRLLSERDIWWVENGFLGETRFLCVTQRI